VGGGHHGEEADVAADLDAADADLDHGALAVGIVKGDVFVGRRRHQGALDSSLPGRIAMVHPEFAGQQH
jgi:hypothetical protein